MISIPHQMPVRLFARAWERLRLVSPALWHWVAAVTAGLALSWMFGRALPAVPPESWIHRALVPLLASVSRFESILHIGPMLVSFAIVHFRAHQTLAGVRFAGACAYRMRHVPLASRSELDAGRASARRVGLFRASSADVGRALWTGTLARPAGAT